MNARDTFGPLGAYHPPVIGLTGLRGVGKSTAADHLVNAYGFRRLHPFDGGKAAAAAYFRHLGATDDEASSMVFGDLRDVPTPILPGAVAPRHFLERFGKFMGVDMGSDWTLGAEIESAWRAEPSRPLVVESVVYEAAAIRAVGGLIIRIVRPGHSGPAGQCTDAAQAALNVDATIINDGGTSGLCSKVAQLAQAMIGGR